MMKLRQSRAPLVAIVSIVITAWLFASNHCALAALASATQQASAHDCCHSENGKTPERSVQCCDALNAPSPTPTIAPVVQFTELMPAWSPLPLYVLAPPEALPVDVLQPSIGPPGLGSFAILVLNRSLLAHAPPVFIV